MSEKLFFRRLRRLGFISLASLSRFFVPIIKSTDFIFIAVFTRHLIRAKVSISIEH